MNVDDVRRRWDQNNPLARVAFFGTRGAEEVAAYGLTGTGHGFLSMAVDRHNGYLTTVAVHVSHLVYVVDRAVRQVRGKPASARVFFDNGQTLDAVIEDARLHPALGREALSCFVYEAAGRVRAILGAGSISEIVPLHDDGQDLKLLTLSDDFSDELWPELGHKRWV